MVLHNSPAALLVSTRTNATPPLNDLAADSGWPLVVKANPRRLATELSLHAPECLLFWLDDEQRIAETAQLVAWVKERGQRPYRLAVAYRMAADVEALLRAAGAHAFMHTANGAASRVTNFVQGFICDGVQIDAAATPSTSTTTAAVEPAERSMDAVMHLVQPP